MRPRTARWLLSVLVVALCVGCGGMRHYIEARSDDLSDCLRFRLALGQLGLYAEVEATSFMTPSAGLFDVSLFPHYAVGWDPAHPETTIAQVRTAAFPALLVGWPVYGYTETAAGYGDTQPYLRGALAPLILMANHHVEGRTGALLGLDRLLPNPRITPPDEEPEPRPRRDHFWFGGSATAIFVSAGAAFNLLELLDFLAGLLTWDPLKDDYRSQLTFEEEARERELRDAGERESPVLGPTTQKRNA